MSAPAGYYRAIVGDPNATVGVAYIDAWATDYGGTTTATDSAIYSAVGSDAAVMAVTGGDASG